MKKLENGEIQRALINIADNVRHCGDYGHLFWHYKDRHVWWTGGDGDGEILAGHTDLNELEKRFKAVPGVKQVSIEAECDPCEDGGGDGWTDLGRRGYEIYTPSLYEETSSEERQVLEPGWVFLTFDGYGSRDLCHVREGEVKGEPGFLVYSFYHFQLLKYKKDDKGNEHDKHAPAFTLIEKIVQDMSPEYEEAIADIYKVI